MTAGLHLQPAELATVLALLHQHLPGATVWAFGSRVQGWPGQRPLKPHSDLDLAIAPTTPDPHPVAWAQLRHALAESDLPWRVDITPLEDLPTALLGLVQTHGVRICPPSA